MGPFFPLQSNVAPLQRPTLAIAGPVNIAQRKVLHTQGLGRTLPAVQTFQVPWCVGQPLCRLAVSTDKMFRTAGEDTVHPVAGHCRKHAEIIGQTVVSPSNLPAFGWSARWRLAGRLGLDRCAEKQEQNRYQ